LGNLSTPKTVQKLQKALHAKAKAEADYRFYALYDKISREDILAHAFAQCRSNKGAPGVDGQDFADIETYGIERWLGELAIAGVHVRTNVFCENRPGAPGLPAIEEEHQAHG
jgi:RNA-directed DNA polymerase